MVYSSSNSILQNLQMHPTLTIALSLTRRMIVYTGQDTCFRECQAGEKKIVNCENLYTKYFDEVSKTAFLNPLALGDLIFKLTVKLGPQRIQVIQFYTNQISTCVMEVREKVQFQ